MDSSGGRNSVLSCLNVLGPFPPHAFLFGLTSIHWREVWKYEAGVCYCNHDVGHAIGSARIAAATLGWNMALLDGVDQDTVAKLLGTNRKEEFGEAEPEHPDCLAVIWPSENVKYEGSFLKKMHSEIPLFIDSTIVKDLAAGTWHGKANRLSGEHGVHWDIIDEVAAASLKTQTDRSMIAL